MFAFSRLVEGTRSLKIQSLQKFPAFILPKCAKDAYTERDIALLLLAQGRVARRVGVATCLNEVGKSALGSSAHAVGLGDKR